MSEEMLLQLILKEDRWILNFSSKYQNETKLILWGSPHCKNPIVHSSLESPNISKCVCFSKPIYCFCSLFVPFSSVNFTAILLLCFVCFACRECWGWHGYILKLDQLGQTTSKHKLSNRVKNHLLSKAEQMVREKTDIFLLNNLSNDPSLESPWEPNRQKCN